ncbi:MAG: PDZ domain-containing protein [Blastocatellia bacterium]
MKGSVILFLSVLLVSSSTTLAEDGLAQRSDQDGDRPRRVEISRPSFLGVELQEVTRESAQRLKLSAERGALIENVTPESSAAKGGLKKDDVIVKWNGELIESAREVSRRIRETPAGRTVRLGVVRDGNETESSVTLGERREYATRVRVAPAAAVARVRPARESRVMVRDRYRMGVSLQSMSPQLAEYFGLTGRNGALVLYVYPDSPAANAGIKAGDVILSVGGETTDDPIKVHEALKSKAEGSIEIRVLRDKQEKTLTVQLEKAKTSWFVSPGDFDVAEPDINIVPIPSVLIDPIHIPRIVVGPLNVTPLVNVTPLAIPEISIPQIRIPRITLPPMKISVPYRLKLTV